YNTAAMSAERPIPLALANKPLVERDGNLVHIIPQPRLELLPTTEPEDPDPGEDSTETHEAEHAVPAVVNGTGVKLVTVVPKSGEYNGLTVLHKPDIIAAVGPDVNGRRGTSYDVF